MLVPLKKFSQNFLIDKNIQKKIVAEFNPSINDIILEIGPGTGAITELLYQSNQKIYLVEIDNRASEILKIKYPKAEILNIDFLDFDFKKYFSGKRVRIIGNIPYNITSQILLKLFDNSVYIKDIFMMVQKEVAKRLTAKSRTKDFGILTLYTQYYSEAKYLFEISRNVFNPRPNVDSAIIKFEIKENRELEANQEILLKKIIRAAFNNRRKMLRNSLTKLFDINTINLVNYDFTKRSDEISLTDYINLTKLFHEIIK